MCCCKDLPPFIAMVRVGGHNLRDVLQNLDAGEVLRVELYRPNGRSITLVEVGR